MKLWTKILFVLLFFSLIFLPKIIFAHPGNTASDGCHYCRTNCDKWGVPWNERHCHGGGTVETIQTVKTVQPTSTPRPTLVPTRVPTKIPTVIPTNTLAPTLVPTLSPTETPTILPTNTPTITPQILGTETTKKDNTSDGGLGSLAIVAWVIFGGYKLVKKFKNKQ